MSHLLGLSQVKASNLRNETVTVTGIVFPKSESRGTARAKDLKGYLGAIFDTTARHLSMTSLYLSTLDDLLGGFQ